MTTAGSIALIRVQLCSFANGFPARRLAHVASAWARSRRATVCKAACMAIVTWWPGRLPSSRLSTTPCGRDELNRRKTRHVELAADVGCRIGIDQHAYETFATGYHLSLVKASSAI